LTASKKKMQPFQWPAAKDSVPAARKYETETVPGKKEEETKLNLKTEETETKLNWQVR
jgi:hypothetical protein